MTADCFHPKITNNIIRVKFQFSNTIKLEGELYQPF